MANAKGKVHHSKLRSTLDLDTLPTEWDSDATLRERMRSGGTILHPSSGGGEDIPTCVHNKELLLPLLTRMATSEKKSMPSIHDLHTAVEGLLILNKRAPKPEDFHENMASSWRIRFLLGFIKMKARRREVSRVEDFQFLCLQLDPSLQELVDAINARETEKRAARQAAEEKGEAWEEDEEDNDDNEPEEDYKHEEEEQQALESADDVANGEKVNEEYRTEEHLEAKPPTIPADSAAPSAPASSEPTPPLPPRETETSSEGAKNDLLEKRQALLQKLELIKKKKSEEEAKRDISVVAPPLSGQTCPPGSTLESFARDNQETCPLDITEVKSPQEPSVRSPSPPMSSEQRRAAFQRRDPNETSGSGKGGSTSDGGKVTSETPEELQKLRDLKSQSMDPKKVKADDNNAEHFTDTDVEDNIGVPVTREEQMKMKKSEDGRTKGRGRGRGKGKGRGRGKEKALRGSSSNPRKRSASTNGKESTTKKKKQTETEHWEWQDWAEEWDSHWWDENEEWDTTQWNKWDQAAWQDGKHSLYNVAEGSNSTRKRKHSTTAPHEKKPKKNKRVKSAGSTKDKQPHEEPEASKQPHAEPETTSDKKPAKGKKKDTAKDKPQKSKKHDENKSKSANPASKASPSPKAKVAAKAKVSPRAKAAPKALAMPPIPAQDRAAQVEQSEDFQRVTKVLFEFGSTYKRLEASPTFDVSACKDQLKKVTTEKCESDECGFNLYWTRPAVGVKSRTHKRDFAYFAVHDNGINGKENHWARMALAMKSAQLLAMYVDELIASDERIGRDIPLDITSSPAVSQKGEIIKIAAKRAYERMGQQD